MAGGTPLGQMYIELGLDVSKFNPSLTSAKNAVKYFQNNVKALDSTLKSHGNISSGNQNCRGTWVAQSVEHPTLDFWLWS